MLSTTKAGEAGEARTKRGTDSRRSDSSDICGESEHQIEVGESVDAFADLRGTSEVSRIKPSHCCLSNEWGLCTGNSNGCAVLILLNSV